MCILYLCLSYPSVGLSTCLYLSVFYPSLSVCLSCGRVWRTRIRTVNWSSCSHPFWPTFACPPAPAVLFPSNSLWPFETLPAEPHHTPPDRGTPTPLSPSVARSVLCTLLGAGGHGRLFSLLYWKGTHSECAPEWAVWWVFTVPIDTCCRQTWQAVSVVCTTSQHHREWATRQTWILNSSVFVCVFLWPLGRSMHLIPSS